MQQLVSGVLFSLKKKRFSAVAGALILHFIEVIRKALHFFRLATRLIYICWSFFESVVYFFILGLFDRFIRTSYNLSISSVHHQSHLSPNRKSY